MSIVTKFQRSERQEHQECVASGRVYLRVTDQTPTENRPNDRTSLQNLKSRTKRQK